MNGAQQMALVGAKVIAAGVAVVAAAFCAGIWHANRVLTTP